jgi:hypothetical protein
LSGKLPVNPRPAFHFSQTANGHHGSFHVVFTRLLYGWLSGFRLLLGGSDMTRQYWPFSGVEIFVEPFLRGLVLALLAIIGI